jgi:hypothetical protein
MECWHERMQEEGKDQLWPGMLEDSLNGVVIVLCFVTVMISWYCLAE